MKVFIIAEAGVNHNGSPQLAAELVKAAAQAGADAVKFQTFKAERIASRHAQKANYQSRLTDPGSQREMLRKLELSETHLAHLSDLCGHIGIEFLSTPFDHESVDVLTGIGVKRLKISSGDLTNAPLLLKAASTGLPVILSTGMARIDEIANALGVLAFGYLKKDNPSKKSFEKARLSAEGQTALQDKVVLLHCTTEYPAPLEDVNLRAMETLAVEFGLPVGYSDHTPGTAVPVAAAALGACVIEKHFTISRDLPGPDQRASLEPSELKSMIEAIREVEEALGSPVKAPAPSEKKNMPAARRSLVALRPVRKGELFSRENLGVKRPGTGLSPLEFWDYLGKPAERDYEEDELI